MRNNFVHSKNAIIFLLASIVFIVLFILLKLNFIYYLDDAIYKVISLMICPPITALFIFITTLGGEYVLISVTSIMLVFFRKNKYSLFIFFNLLITFMLNAILKIAISRPRPPIENMLQENNGYSFPSGHSMCSMAFWGTIAYCIYLYAKPSKLRSFLIIFIPILIMLIGISRIYLGAHYFSDVIAGFSLGIAILSVSFSFYKKSN